MSKETRVSFKHYQSRIFIDVFLKGEVDEEVAEEKGRLELDSHEIDHTELEFQESEVMYL